MNEPDAENDDHIVFAKHSFIMIGQYPFARLATFDVNYDLQISFNGSAWRGAA